MTKGRPRNPDSIEVRSGNVRLYVARRPSGRWQFDYRDRDGKRRSVERTTKKAAIEAAQSAAATIGGNEPRQIKVGRDEYAAFLAWRDQINATEELAAVFAGFAESKARSASLSSVYRKHIRRETRNALAFFGGDTPMAAILASDVDDYLDSLKGAQTRHNARRMLITIWRWARDRGYIPETVRTEAEKSSKPFLPKPKIETLTPDQMAAVLDDAGKAFLPWFLIGGFAGLRSDEIATVSKGKSPLDWSDFDWDGGFIDMRPETSKQSGGGRRRIIPIHENLRHWMERAGVPKAGPILTAGTSVLYREVRRVSGRVLGREKWPRNSLRHSYATYRMALTRDASRVSEELGNSPGIVRRHYDQVATPQEGAAWFQIEPD